MLLALLALALVLLGLLVGALPLVLLGLSVGALPLVLLGLSVGALPLVLLGLSVGMLPLALLGLSVGALALVLLALLVRALALVLLALLGWRLTAEAVHIRGVLGIIHRGHSSTSWQTAQTEGQQASRSRNNGQEGISFYGMETHTDDYPCEV